MKVNPRKEAGAEDLPNEKWLVAFRDKRGTEATKNIFIRQFFAPGFYEAYDIIFSHAERLKLEVVWFKEKRACGSLAAGNFQTLETACTYCNKKFNYQEAIPCIAESCSAEFCSRSCLDDHRKLRHG